MRIDLHCHTKKTKSGDPVTRNVTKEMFLEKLVDSSVSFVAITNHNDFDLRQYNEFSNNDKGITVFPGIELDIEGKNSSGHCLLITSPSNATTFDGFIKEMMGNETAEDFVLDIDTFAQLIGDGDYILIPHFNKSNSMSESDINYLKEKIGSVPVILEASNLRSAGIMIAHNKATLIGSDVRDWSQYNSIKLPNLKFKFSNYEQFTRLLKKDVALIETFVKGKFSEEVHVKPAEYEDCNVKLNIYNDINIIFGNKGTGKTELLLTEIMKHFENKGNADVSCYFPNAQDSSGEFDKLKDTKLTEADLANLFSDSKIDDFNVISNHTPVSITPTSEYFKWVEANEQRKSLFGFAASTFVESKEVLESGYKAEKTRFTKTVKSIKDIANQAVEPYISSNDVVELKRILDSLFVKSRDILISSFTEYKAMHLLEWSISKFKALYESKKGEKTKPASTGFITLFENSLKLYKSASAIKASLEVQPKKTKKAIGDLLDKGTIYKEVEYSVNPNNIISKSTNYLNDKLNKGNFLKYKKKIDNLTKNAFTHNEKDNVVKFREECDSFEITKLSDLLFCNTRIVDQRGNVYEPSPGEKAMLMLNYKLMDDKKNVYILDEPEARVGHKYINDVIIPRLLDLARRDKKIIITTHDANIAVRTLPLTSIYREQHRVGETIEYRTYIGSPFLDEMVCYGNNNIKIDWVTTSMNTLEGGEDAFIERGKNYGK